MQRLLFIRHGETDENLAGIMQGQSRGTLSTNGRKQIALLAERLSGERFDKIFSSDLPRSKETVEAIAEYHSCSVTFSPLLRERSSGILEGKTNTEYHAAIIASDCSPETFRPEQGESIEDLWMRCSDFLDLILNNERSETILISSHSGPTACFICLLTGKPIQDFWSVKQDNTCVNSFWVSDRKVVNSTLNCVSHLETSNMLG